MIAGSLEIQMLANMAELKKQMDQGVGVVKGASEQMIRAADMAGKALGAIGVALSVSAFTGFIKKAIDSADALDEMSGRVGVSAKELSQLRLAYMQAGMGNDAMASSMAKLSKEMSDGNVGLRALGINAKNTDGTLRGTTSVLMDVADKFKGLDDGAGKTALAMEIFGKSGAEMVPLLNGGSEGIRELTEMSEKLGLVIENETAAQAGQFNDTLELLQLGVEGVGSRVAAKLLPTLTNLTGSFLESMTAGDRLSGVADFLATSLKVLYSVGFGVAEVFNTLGKTVGAAAAAVMAVLRGDLEGAKNIMTEFRSDVTTGWQASGAAISKAWNDEGDSAVAAAAKTMKSSKDLLGAQKEREASAKKSADAAAKAAADQAKQLADSLKQFDGLLAQDSGLDKDFHKKWEALNTVRKSGKRSVEELIQAQAALLAQQPFMKKGIEEEMAARKAWRDERQKGVDTVFAAAKALDDDNKQLREEIQLIGKSKKEQETILRLRREQVIVLREGELAALQAKNSFDVYDTAMIEALQGQIKQLKERNELLGQKQVADDSAELVETQKGEWTSFFQSIDNTAHQTWTNVFENGAGSFKRLGQTLKSAVLDVLYQMTVRKWIINIGASLFGGGSSIAASAAEAVLGKEGGGGILGSLGSLFSNGSSLYNLFTGKGFIGNVTQYLSNMFGFGGEVAPAAGYGAPAGAGLVEGGAIPEASTSWASGASDWVTGGGWAMAIPFVAAYLGGMFKDEKQVGQGITGTLGGDMYGYQLMRESGGLFDGPDYRYVIAEKEIKDVKAKIEALKNDPDYDGKGEAARAAKLQALLNKLDNLERDYGDAIAGSQGPIKVLQDAFKAMREGTAKQADSLGLDGDSIRKMQVELGLEPIHADTGGKGLELTGLTQEEASAKIAQALDQANEELARSVLGSWQEQTREVTRTVWDQVLVDDGGDTEHYARVGTQVTDTITEQVWVMSEYVREGETAVQALGRLSSSLVGVNSVFDLLGGTLVDASLAGADWASSLVDAIGGMDALAAAAGTYYDLYYSDAEKQARLASQANKGMEDKGLDLRVSDADAKQKYRDMVDKAIADKDEELLAWLWQFGDDFAAGVDSFTSGVDQAATAMQEKIVELATIREETLSTIGLSMDGLVDGFINEINEGRGAHAGGWLADQIAYGFEEAVYQQGVTAILSSMIDGMITPMVNAAMTGSSIADAVSGAAIDNMIANANAALAALNTLLSSTEFIEGMEKIKVTITKLGNTMGASIPPMRNYQAAVTNTSNAYDKTASAADEAAKAAQKLTDEWSKLVDSMLNEMKRLRGELLGGTSDEGAAYYEAMFAIKTAQARAGDQEAAGELPAIIRALEAITKANAGTQSDAFLKQAEWLASLTETREYLAAKYGVDIGNQRTADAAAATSGRVIQTTGSAAFSGALQSSSDNPAVLTELRALRSEVEYLRKDQRSIAESELTSLGNIDRSTKRLVQRAETEAT